ncbi:hypothetical protein FHT77_005969 [Rhizobium sp. BK181]|uniref:hypothetical protein n=1 Tax=Rhizobium sp. BK181 TaxID=2587072 RepID=UPI00161EABAE|nr:hypothetical protein [Rhizobium sp. BK181]MBB3320050.1 hypothetical protein [Rhizobium sp. BK181]
MSDKTPPLVVVRSAGPQVKQSQDGHAKPAQQTDDADPEAELTIASTDTEKAFSDLMTIIGLSTAVWSVGMSVAWATWLSPLTFAGERRE